MRKFRAPGERPQAKIGARRFLVMPGVVGHSQQHMGRAPGVGTPGVGGPGGTVIPQQSPMLDVVDRFQVANRHECLHGIGQQSRRPEDPQDRHQPAGLEYHSPQHLVPQPWKSGGRAPIQPLLFQSPSAFELACDAAAEKRLIGFAETRRGGVFLSSHPAVVAVEVFDGKVVITAQGEQQTSQGIRHPAAAVDQLVPRHQAGMGAMAAQQQFHRQQVGESVFKARIQAPAPAGAHFQQQPQVDHEQTGYGADHRRGQISRRSMDGRPTAPAGIIGQHRQPHWQHPQQRLPPQVGSCQQKAGAPKRDDQGRQAKHEIERRFLDRSLSRYHEPAEHENRLPGCQRKSTSG